MTLTAYSAAPGTPDHDALRLLASWAATTETNALAPHGDQGHRAFDR